MKISLVKKKSEFHEKITEKIPTFVEFFAQWCGPCHKMSPLIESIADEFKWKLNMVKVDIENSDGLANEYNISSVPTFIIFKNGKQIKTHHGTISYEKLKIFIEDVIGNNYV
ncbi:MAG: thioredoxin family protein [Firmicutes bacterium]|nr:thioredoxin family protein [Bacillota bacterium]